MLLHQGLRHDLVCAPARRAADTPDGKAGGTASAEQRPQRQTCAVLRSRCEDPRSNARRGSWRSLGAWQPQGEEKAEKEEGEEEGQDEMDREEEAVAEGEKQNEDQ